VDAIKDDIAMLKSDLAAAMRDLIHAGRSGAGDARQRLQDIVGDRLDSLNEAAGNLGERGRLILRDVRNHARERPLRTAVIALGIGATIGALYYASRHRD
jgi:ElaB/YqjD/DUF883 family membrane-anchored ribosome-binding protein